MARTRMVWDDEALWEAVNAAAKPLVADAVEDVTARANSMSAGFRTGKYHVNHQSPHVGETQPRYEGNVERHGRTDVGLVYTGNYSAMKDNHLNNTLLKARG